ncbi:hypothetical protein [Methylomonas sp. MgM2]
MLIKAILPLAGLSLIQSSVFAEQAANIARADEIGTTLLVNLLIIAVYTLYWLKQKA